MGAIILMSGRETASEREKRARERKRLTDTHVGDVFSLLIWNDSACPYASHTLNYCDSKYKLLTLIAFFKEKKIETLFIIRVLFREFMIFENIIVVMRLPTHIHTRTPRHSFMHVKRRKVNKNSIETTNEIIVLCSSIRVTKENGNCNKDDNERHSKRPKWTHTRTLSLLTQRCGGIEILKGS